LTVVAPPLLVIGAPHALSARVTGRALRRLRPLAWPPLTWALFAVALLAVHLTGLFDYALDHPWAHGLEHGALFWTAVAFWAPVCAAPPAPRRLGPIARLGYLLLAMAPMGLIGALLMNNSDPVYSHYSVSAQSDAGAAMWVGGGYVLVIATVLAAWESLEAEERRQRARERYE
jgi:cytochrome c oxidase assembly factor CtaG